MIHLKSNNIFKFIFKILILVFLFLIVASQSGYYEYELSRKTKLTDEAIDKFENDVKEGKNIDINNYLVNEKKDYNNDVSNFGRKFSDKIESVFSKGFDYLFRYIDSQNKK